MSQRQGRIWYGDSPVGRLREDARRTLHFTYDVDWLVSGFPISIQLPLSVGDREVPAHAFFQGLLPEGRIRQRICRQHGLDTEDDMGLLLAIGEDCAGALSVLPATSSPHTSTARAQTLTSAQLEQLVLHAGDPGGWTVPQRFSLAGAQEKQPVIRDAGDNYQLPDRLHPSSHILKFETLPKVCFAEFMANALARRLGLTVVETEFLTLETEAGRAPYLRIERYDRRVTHDGQSSRLHQEDVLQALGLPALCKYPQDGGPGIGAVAELLRAHAARPVDAVSQLRDWQLFNYLIGNWDGHGKNLALTYQMGEGAPQLAPFYDLIAIEFFNRLRPGSWSREMAFSIGAHVVPEQINREDWQQFARDIGVPAKPLLARLEQLATMLPDLARVAVAEFSERFDSVPAYEKLAATIDRRCRWVQQHVLRS